MTRQPLDAIVGEQLSSVEFVQDYVQLRFDGPYLTLYTYPAVKVGDSWHVGGAPGYRDLLCDRITKKVRSAAVVSEKEIRIEFEDGASISIALCANGCRGPEAAMFQNTLESTWAVW